MSKIDDDGVGFASALRAGVEHRSLTADDLSTTEYEVAAALCRLGAHHPPLELGATVCGTCAELATIAVLALADRLMPEGATRETEYGLARDDRESVAPYKSREQAELWRGYSEPGWEVVCREAVTTPWRPAAAVGTAGGGQPNASDLQPNPRVDRLPEE